MNVYLTLAIVERCVFVTKYLTEEYLIMLLLEIICKN